MQRTTRAVLLLIKLIVYGRIIIVEKFANPHIKRYQKTCEKDEFYANIVSHFFKLFDYSGEEKARITRAKV